MNMECYPRKQFQPIPHNTLQVTNVVVNLVAKCDLSNKGYHVICPPWGPGGLSRECVLRIPMRVVKGDSNGAPLYSGGGGDLVV